MLTLSYFSRLAPFHMFFGQVREWLVILELHETIKVSHILPCQIVFILLRDLVRHGGVLKHKECSILSDFCCLGLVPQVFLGILRRGLYYILLILVISYL